ncbi:MAG TPA: nucleotidyl transferase AbiEii/AbiGii toxin family protein [Planctomycetota bacterium]|nr:nucleotidyl transferase AbiEii/AbiGii toxin family protein [Planctomycetota bacterium]
MSAPLTTDLRSPDAVPYFTWDDPMTVSQIRERLATASESERLRLLAKILREARDTDVWHFTTLKEVRASWPEIEPMLGRRRGFWAFLLDQCIGATVESVLASPHHRRFLARRAGEGLVVDLVHDPKLQGVADKPVHDGVRVDPAAEMLANKLCALLSRLEVRDIVDVMALEKAGLSIEDAILLAQKKDAGLTPAQLAWVLSGIRLGPDVRIPEGISLPDIQRYLADLARRLAALGRPH